MHDSAPEFELVRKLNKELRGGSVGNKLIRHGLKEVLSLVSVKTLNNRLAGHLRKIIGSGEGVIAIRNLKILTKKRKWENRY